MRRILSTRPRRQRRATRLAHVPKPASRAACAMRGCVAIARAACHDVPGQRGGQIGDRLGAAEQPDRRRRARLARPDARCGIVEAARQPPIGDHGRRTCRRRRRSRAPASRGPPAGPAHRRRARSARASPARTCARTWAHSASESNCAASAAGASIARGRHAGLPQRARGAGAGRPAARTQAGQQRRWHRRRNARRPRRSRTSARVVGRGAATLPAAPPRRQRLDLDQGQRQASSPAARSSLDPARRLARGPRDDHAWRRHLFSARRPRAAARATCVAERAGLREIGDRGLRVHAHQRRRRLRDRPRPHRCAGCSPACQRACAASGIEQLPPMARLTARSAAVASQVALVRQRRQQCDQVAAVGAHLDAQRALPGGRQHGVGLEDAADAAAPGPGASGRPRPARWRRTGLRRACAGGCRGCRARARCAGRAAARAAAPRGAGWRCRPPRLAAGRRARRGAADTSASRGSSRSSTQASAKPAGRSIGTSLSECTAMSARPSSSASSSSFTNRPLPPTLLSERSRIWSPRVVMPSRLTAWPRCSQQGLHVLGLPEGQAAFARGDDDACSRPFPLQCEGIAGC